MGEPARKLSPAPAPAARVPEPAPRGDALLAVRDLHAWYGESHILHGMNFEVRKGELVTLIGRNGAGKTTTLKSIMGMVGRRKGSIRYAGQELLEGAPSALSRFVDAVSDLTIRRLAGAIGLPGSMMRREGGLADGMPSHKVARLGLAFCPEERGIFASLNVNENLLLPPVIRPGGMSVADIHRLFPNLKEREKSQGTKLSGGEQQMLAIARILRTGAEMLLLDEPTEGLAPVVIEQIGNAIRKMKEKGFTILLVEQNFRFAATVADRFYVVEHGQVIDMIPREKLEARMGDVENYLGV